MDELTTHDFMASAMLERGLMSAEQVAQSRAQLEGQLANGFDPLAVPGEAKPAAQAQAGSKAAPDNTAPTVDPLDALVFEGAKSPAEYNFSNGPTPPGADAAPLEFQSAIRNTFHSNGVPAAVGNQIAVMWNKAMAQPAPTDAQLDLGKREAMAALHKMWGADTPANLKLANAEIARWTATQPNIPKLLEVSGLGNSPWLIATLANLAKGKGRTA